MKFGITKDTLKERLSEVNSYLDKIDTYSLYEYLSGEIDEEKFKEYLENFNPQSKRKPPVKVSVAEFKPTENPGRGHKFPATGARQRCLHCNCIYKYCHKEDCPMYKGDETAGSTVTEN